MMIKDVLEKIKTEFTIDGIVHQRYYHTIGVIEMALTLNNVHKLNISQKKIILASAFHDIAKLLDKKTMWDILSKYYTSELELLKDYPQIWHSFVGEIYAKEKYGIDDIEVLNAIKYHTTGHKDMTKLEKVVFVSDYIEKITRKEQVMIETRKIAFKSLDQAVIKILENTILYLRQNKKKVYYLTNETYNYYLVKEN
ncbi:MAG: bis(5'-nucleosyl)-tetraphosphatase (symmetrical) YqeK [Bacilli bacterium]|nr:bis(5'-nucleosyl)-tetraphosphatase (symmetrical) YqeK [Staphylococcus sp.]